MADLPEIGVSAVIENLDQFTKGADKINQSYEDMDKGASLVGKTSTSLSGILTGLGTVLTTGLVAAAAAAAAAIAGIAVALGTVAVAAFNMSSDVNDATNNIQTDLGTTEEEAERLGKIATDIWANNFGESVSEVSDALVIAKQRFEDINDVDLQNVVQDAYMLQDAFGVDLSESLAAADVLAEKFGITTDEAMNFITKGFQKGLNSSGDFLDSITEYGGLFGQSGADAGEFFSILETGLAGGVLGTDKAADLFKEFSLRIVDGSDSTVDALETLQEPTEDFIAQLQDGSLTVSDVFTIMKDRIADLDDPIEQQRLGVALFGTQWEDLGTKAVFAIDSSATSLEDMIGATDTLNKQYDNLGDLFQDIWRDALVTLLPLGDALLQVGKDIMPLLQEAFTELQPAIAELAEWMGTQLYATASQLIPIIRDNLVPVLRSIAEWVINEGVPALMQFATWIYTDLIPAISEWYKWFKENIWPIIVQVSDVIKNKIIPAISDFASWITGTLIPALKDMWKWFDENIMPVVEELFKMFSKDGKKAGGIISKVWDDINKRLQPLIKKSLPMILDLWDDILKWTKKNWPLIQETIKTVIAFINKYIISKLQEIEKFWDKWGDTIMDIVETVFGIIFKIVKTNMNNVLDIITLIMQIITGDWEGAWDTIVGILERTWDNLVDIAGDAANLMMSVISDVMENIKKDIESKWNEIKSAISSALSSIKDTVSSKFSEIKNTIIQKWNEIISSVKSKVQEMVNTITNTISSAVSSIANSLINTIQSALNSLASAISGGSIYNTLKTIGQNIINGIISGVQAVTNFVSSIVAQITTWISQLITFIVSGGLANLIKSIGTQIIAKIISGIQAFTTFVSTVRTTISGWITSIVNSLGAIATAAYNVGRKIIDNLLSGVSSMASKFKQWIKEKIEEWLGDIFSPVPSARHMGEVIIDNLLFGIAGQKNAFVSALRGSISDWMTEGTKGFGGTIPMMANLIGAGAIGGEANLSSSLLPPSITGMPSAAVGGMTTNNSFQNVFQTTIMDRMDEVVFHQRVVNVLRKELG